MLARHFDWKRSQNGDSECNLSSKLKYSGHEGLTWGLSGFLGGILLGLTEQGRVGRLAVSVKQ